jgi:hypothetical protein
MTKLPDLTVLSWHYRSYMVPSVVCICCQCTYGTGTSAPGPTPMAAMLWIYVFGPPGTASGSVSHKGGSDSGSFHHQAKILRKTLISTVWWLPVFRFRILRSRMFLGLPDPHPDPLDRGIGIRGFGPASGSVSDPQHWSAGSLEGGPSKWKILLIFLSILYLHVTPLRKPLLTRSVVWALHL